ncbi:ubiquitin carboxyl-terminal hydrolase MINDY-1-like [Chenopodium quinoa]|uniref:ubiquitin carboxyl-terminal hydrolase MINDY-1-like n=1 Tax=Chenopodium quinoa TaxID=63459 RepID=UPI000B787AB5|nr:ubiquitin carboxyl-terminal hydrolase MINDY-1-like [Chenopodium quinoa]
MASSSEEQQQQQPQSQEQQQSSDETASESVLHKTKTINFFGRSTPIILQNDNGPCPLIAICNVLLLRNELNLSADVSEVSQEKLLSLVAERLLDSDSNNNNKDAGYVENQQQNISDAINLLPWLTTGIDVNVKFDRIDAFEFTPECAIFDLLGIPLYHGWLVDPQDHETAEAIESKSYNTLMGDLVALETWKMENVGKDKSDEDCIDFAAATTAALGVPSPSLSRAKSFDESPRSASDQQIFGKGDAEEEAQLLEVLKLSKADLPSNIEAVPAGDVIISFDENVHMSKSPMNSAHVSEGHSTSGLLDVEPSVSGSDDVHGHFDRKLLSSEEQALLLSFTNDSEKDHDQLFPAPLGEVSLSNDLAECKIDTAILSDPAPAKDTVNDQKAESLSTPVIDVSEGLHKLSLEQTSSQIAGHAGYEPSSGSMPSIEAVESFTPSLDGSEPIYEGEECILDPGKTLCEDHEPVYEGEVVLAEQADNGVKDASDVSPKHGISLRQGELIDNFLKGNASQLTFYGLFCLQAGLDDHKLCVFFRNNHFSTMFKLDGELYLLATDQGYMNQPDLVWEKLNEINGDTLFMTSNFKEFRLESSSNGTWDQQNAVANTADYLASIDNSKTNDSNMNSDLQLAIALQQQEFEQQQQQRNPPQQASSAGGSRLITGPQVPRSSAKATSSSSTPRQDQKSKDKSNCKIM